MFVLANSPLAHIYLQFLIRLNSLTSGEILNVNETLFLSLKQNRFMLVFLINIYCYEIINKNRVLVKLSIHLCCTMYKV